MTVEKKIKQIEEIIKLELPEDVPSLTSLYIYAAGSCNLACKHCWIEPTFQKNNSELGLFVDLDDVKKVVQEAKPLGLHNVKLTGGEPLLHPRFRELVDIIVNEGASITIETNGILVDRNMAEFLRSSGKVTFISISVDGDNARTHDDLRGVKGSFKKAVSGIKYLADAGFKPQLICSLHRDNFEQAEAVVKFAESLGCSSVKFNHIQKIGRGEKFANDKGLEIDEILEQAKYLEKNVEPDAGLRIYYSIPMAFFSIKRLQGKNLGRCTVKNILGMLSGGELSLCGIGTSVPDLVFGHIKKDHLRDVWEKSPGLLNLRKMIPAEFKGICGNCIHKNVCMGSCIANNYFRTNELNAPYDFCYSAKELNLFPESRMIKKNKECKNEQKQNQSEI